MCGFNFYSVTLLWSTFSDTRFINGSVTGFKIKPTTKNPIPNNVNIINFVIRISGQYRLLFHVMNQLHT